MNQEVWVGSQIAAKVQGQVPGSPKRNRTPETVMKKCAGLETLLCHKLCLCILVFKSFLLGHKLIEVTVWWDKWGLRCFLWETSVPSGHSGRQRVTLPTALTLLCSPIDLRLCSKL